MLNIGKSLSSLHLTNIVFKNDLHKKISFEALWIIKPITLLKGTQNRGVAILVKWSGIVLMDLRNMPFFDMESNWGLFNDII